MEVLCRNLYIKQLMIEYFYMIKLVEKYSNTSGFKSTLDWETTQRFLKEQMSKN